MNQSIAIFELMDCLTPGEKRHFRLLSGVQSGVKQYVQLFDAVEEAITRSAGSSRDYAAIDREIRQRLASEKVIANNQYPVVKNHLYGHILKSLRFNREDKQEPDAKLNNGIIEANLLEEKGLYNQALAKLIKTREFAEKYEKLPQLVDILDRLIRLNAEHPADKKKWYNFHTALQEAKARVVENLQWECTYKALYFDALALFKSKTEIKEADEKIAKIFRHELLGQPEKAQTFNAQIYLYSLLSFQHTLYPQ